ncbi:hypothetical protein SAMN06265379_10837 [Saccharicrinis carchari]|uniref:Uncharacterized protein n=1 Tax=Saccharicrinis carchari TaxID=1168039 RepID=A0A521E8X1_SACCC|nr:hypothetical protein [Saccharicrinis carchari]SMO80367.1 hypothetical protein SAMN06265379_10837 [Saccharicrinis carchari]
MKKTIYILLLATILIACGSNKSKVEEIQVEIPAALNDNTVAKELIEDMTDAVNSCRQNMATGAKFAIEQEKSGSDSLTVRQGFKAAKFAAKMMIAAKKIEKVKDEALQLKEQLNATEWAALETKLDELETRVGDLNPEDLGLSEEEIARFKAEGELHIGKEAMAKTDEPVTEKELAANQEDLENGAALRELEESVVQTANENDKMQQAENDSAGGSGWFVILFIILVFVLIIFGVTRRVKSYKQKFRNTSNTFSQIRNQFNNKN